MCHNTRLVVSFSTQETQLSTQTLTVTYGNSQRSRAVTYTIDRITPREVDIIGLFEEADFSEVHVRMDLSDVPEAGSENATMAVLSVCRAVIAMRLSATTLQSIALADKWRKHITIADRLWLWWEDNEPRLRAE